MKRKPLCIFVLIASLTGISAAQTRPTTTISNTIDPPGVADATLITLQLNQADADAAIAELSHQTGFEIKPYNDSSWKQGPMGKVTLSVDKQPFWSVLLQMGTQAGFSLMQNDSVGRRLTLLPFHQGGQDASKYPTFISGAFLIQGTGIQRQSTVEFATGKTISRSLNMQLMIYVEPRVHVLGIENTPEILQATDNHGHSLLTPSQNRNVAFQNSRTLAWGVSVSLNVPEKDLGDSIPLLRGRLHATVQTKSETIEIPEILTAKEQTKTVGRRRITFKSFKKQNERQYQAEIVIRRNASMSDEEFSHFGEGVTVRLLDSEGNEYWSNGGGSSNNGDEITRQIFFYKRSRDEGGGANLGDPSKLTIEVPTVSRNVAVPFEFVNLPLP